MHFNNLKTVFLFLLLLSNIRCGLHIGEPSDVQSIGGFSIGCLNNVGKKIESYLSGKAEVNQIHQLSNCIKTALNVFKEQVQGNKVDEFTPNELRKFIQELFLQDRTISDPLLAQMIRLKKVIIGGSEDKLTKADIDRFIIFIDILGKELVLLQPYIQVFYDPEKSFLQLSKTGQLDELQNDLKKSISRISDFAKRFSHPYAFADIEILVRELDMIANGQIDIQDLDKKMEVIKSLKDISVNGSVEEITPEEWGDLLLSYFYSISFTSYYSILRDRPLISVQSMQHAQLMVNNILNFLSQAVDSHSDKVIPESVFMEFMFKLQSVQWIPATLTEQSIRGILNIFFGKIFNVDKERYGTVELSKPQLQKMKKILETWMETQTFLDDSMTENRSILDTMTAQMVAPFIVTENILFGENSNFLYDIFSLKPLYKESNKVHLSRELYATQLQESSTNYKNLTIYNFYYLIAEMIRIGYQSESSDGSSIKQSEIEEFFTDFYPIQMAMGLVPTVDSSHLAQGEMEFLFTKLAVPFAKGFVLDLDIEQELSAIEIIQYLSYAFSIGFSLRTVSDALSKRCLKNDNIEIDPHLINYNKDCVQLYFLSKLSTHVENMPDLILVLENMSNEDKSDFIKAFMDIAFESEELAQSSQIITNYQVKYMFTALYLIETTMNRFDFNNDSLLQEAELWEAYKIFEGYLRRAMINLVCRDDLDDLPVIYAYAVHNKGVLPYRGSMGFWDKLWIESSINLLSSLYNSFDYNYWDIELDRIGLTQVYSNLGKAFIKKKKKLQETSCEEIAAEEDQ